MQYVRDEKVLDIVKDLIGPNVRSIHTMLINKPTDLGKNISVHPVHQDLLYFPMRPANKIVAAWTAMQHIDEKNCWLYVVPKSHKLGLLPHVLPEGQNKAYQGIKPNIVEDLNKEYNLPEKVSLIMEPGDTVFFHPCLFHGSGPNNSETYRKAISCHYASAECDLSPFLIIYPQQFS
eukprot:snap_masked-scaffold_13-processed-gene-1.43-mRNA-1 protein AED:0.18 eAED:0.18 QI:0/-1/0/1/-1/1/1/0/176